MAKRKRRTREHIVEDLSENYLERMVLYDSIGERAFWIEIEDLLRQSLNLDQSTETIRIPVSNELSRQAIDLFRQKSLEVIKKIGSKDVDGQSKPR